MLQTTGIKFHYFALVFRVFSRIAVIPFSGIERKENMEDSLNLQVELKPLLDRAVYSICIILKLLKSFSNLRGDNIFKEALTMTGFMDGLDIRTQLNYVFLLFSTGKVGIVMYNYVNCQKCETFVIFFICFS